VSQRIVLIAALVLAITWPSVSPRAEESYTLQRGDILALMVVGTEIAAQMPVATDGTIAVPLAGVVTAAGRTLPDVAEEVRAKVARTSFPIFNDAGRPVAVQLPQSAVTLTIAEYRPVYVDGDVANPGAYPFRPGLTARQAVTLAGGYGLGAVALDNPQFATADLKGELRGLEVRRAALVERIARLREEVAMTTADGTIEADALAAGTAAGPGLPLLHDASAPLAERLAATEAAAVVARRNLLRRDKAYLDEASEWARLRLSMLRDQLVNEKDVLDADQEEFDNIRQLRQTGVVTTSRLSDVRRALLFSSTRYLQTSAEISRTERELDELDYQVRRRNIDETTVAMNGLGAALVELAEVEAGLVATREKLLHVRTERARLDGPGVVTVETIRAGEERPFTDPGLALEPGDVVSVVIDFERAYGG